MIDLNEAQYYDIDYWYNRIAEHGNNVYNYDYRYYAYQLFEKLILKLTDIPNGYIVVLGTHNCVSFDLLCSRFGQDRCIGYDMANPTNHPSVRVGNVLNLTDEIPIAFVHNDIGNFSLTPLAKLHAQRWAARNVVAGGYFLGRNNLNSAKFPLESMMEQYGFINSNLLSLTGLVDLSTVDSPTLEGHMISKRVGYREFY